MSAVESYVIDFGLEKTLTLPLLELELVKTVVNLTTQLKREKKNGQAKEKSLHSK